MENALVKANEALHGSGDEENGCHNLHPACDAAAIWGNYRFTLKIHNISWVNPTGDYFIVWDHI